LKSQALGKRHQYARPSPASFLGENGLLRTVDEAGETAVSIETMSYRIVRV